MCGDGDGGGSGGGSLCTCGLVPNYHKQHTMEMWHVGGREAAKEKEKTSKYHISRIKCADDIDLVGTAREMSFVDDDVVVVVVLLLKLLLEATCWP